MTAGCAGCGDCCDPVLTGWTLDELFDKAAVWEASPDPERDLPGFTAWARENRPDMPLLEALTTRKELLHNAYFILDHWSDLHHPGAEDWPGRHAYLCDAFDPVLRACTAYQDRPPVCSGYPWYGHEPRERQLHPACSYNADVPGHSMVGVLIPITPTTSEVTAP